jgi:hypothetical protein
MDIFYEGIMSNDVMIMKCILTHNCKFVQRKVMRYFIQSTEHDMNMHVKFQVFFACMDIFNELIKLLILGNVYQILLVE